MSDLQVLNEGIPDKMDPGTVFLLENQAKLGHAQGYVYPHDLAEGIAEQQYAPDAIKDREYYTPTRHGAEARYADAVEWTRKHLGRKRS